MLSNCSSKTTSVFVPGFDPGGADDADGANGGGGGADDGGADGAGGALVLSEAFNVLTSCMCPFSFILNTRLDSINKLSS